MTPSAAPALCPLWRAGASLKRLTNTKLLPPPPTGKRDTTDLILFMLQAGQQFTERVLQQLSSTSPTEFLNGTAPCVLLHALCIASPTALQSFAASNNPVRLPLHTVASLSVLG